MRKYTTAVILLTSSIYAQDSLEPTVVTANRIEEPENSSASSITRLTGEDLTKQGIVTLQDALNQSPGLFSTSTAGQRGQTSSLFLRGSTSDHAQLRIDGVRVSGSSAFTGNILGIQSIRQNDRLEILRGPQSALYGSDTIGGTVSLSSARGQGEATHSIFAEGGSFNTFRGTFQSQGQSGELSWVLGAHYEDTDNDPVSGERQDFEAIGHTARFDFDLTDSLTIGLTLRLNESELKQVDRFGGISHFETESELSTLFVEAQLTPAWKSKILAGYYEEDYTAISSFGNQIDTEKTVFEWTNTFDWSESHTTVAGAISEETDFNNASLGLTGLDESLFGLYANHLWRVDNSLTLSAGVRFEDYDDWGNITTWRTTSNYEIDRIGLTLTASAGRAFRAPSFQELFGLPAFGEDGNINLNPETSEGFELGFKQDLADFGQLGFTWFRNNVTNAINDPFGAAPVNLPGTTRAEGYEISYRINLSDTVSLRSQWTHLEDSVQAGLPADTVSATLTWQPSETVKCGVGVNHVGTRTFGAELPSYTTYRLFGNWQMTDNFTLTGRIENLTDKEFSVANFGNFGPTLNGAGVGAFLGVKAEF